MITLINMTYVMANKRDVSNRDRVFPYKCHLNRHFEFLVASLMSPVASLVTTDKCNYVSMCLWISTKRCLFPGIVPLLYSVGNKTYYNYYYRLETQIVVRNAMFWYMWDLVRFLIEIWRYIRKCEFCIKYIHRLWLSGSLLSRWIW